MAGRLPEVLILTPKSTLRHVPKTQEPYAGYRKLRFIGGKPSLQQLKKWIDDGTVTGEIIGGVYFVDLNAELVGSKDPLLFKMLQVE